MGKGKRLKHFNYDVEKFISYARDMCLNMGVRKATVYLDIKEYESLEKYGTEMEHVAVYEKNNDPNIGDISIAYAGVILTFKPKSDE